MERSKGAELLAEAAANALGGIDSDSGFGLTNGGAADLHAHLAALALFRIDLQRRVVLDIFQEGARSS